MWLALKGWTWRGNFQCLSGMVLMALANVQQTHLFQAGSITITKASAMIMCPSTGLEYLAIIHCNTKKIQKHWKKTSWKNNFTFQQMCEMKGSVIQSNMQVFATLNFLLSQMDSSWGWARVRDNCDGLVEHRLPRNTNYDSQGHDYIPASTLKEVGCCRVTISLTYSWSKIKANSCADRTLEKSSSSSKTANTYATKLSHVTLHPKHHVLTHDRHTVSGWQHLGPRLSSILSKGRITRKDAADTTRALATWRVRNESSPNTFDIYAAYPCWTTPELPWPWKKYLLHDSMSLCTSHFPWDLQTTYNYCMALLRVLDSNYCKFSTSLGMCIYCVPATVWMCLEFSFVIFAYLSQETEASLTTREAGSKSKTCFCKGHRCFAVNLYIIVWIMMQLQIEVHLQLDPQQNQVKQVKTRGHCKLKVLAQVNNCPLNSSN